MTALATIADVEAVSRPVPSGDESRVERLIQMVSARVVTYTGQTFEVVADDTVTMVPHDGVVRLPQRPVTAVASVTVNGALLAPATYAWSANGYLTRVVPGYGWDDDYPTNPELWGRAPLTAVYSHGAVDVPDDIAMVVAERVAAIYLASPEAALGGAGGVASKQVAGFTVSYTANAPVQAWEPAHKMTLDAYRRSGLASLRLTT